MKPKIIVVPDVHGRPFWRDVLPFVGKVPIVFLGDYLDPYYDDAVVFKMTQEIVIQNFEEIINLKKSHPDSITLLLGNHDCEYLYGRSICDVRCDKMNFNRIQSLFRENKECFQIASECRISGKPYIFSHAGLHIRWLDDTLKEWTPSTMVSQLNNLNVEVLAYPDPEQTDFAKALAKRDKHRSGKEAVGSPIWADAESYLSEYLIADIVQVVGHTWTCYRHPGITDTVFFLDCGMIFQISNGGKLYDKNGKLIREKEDPFNPVPDPMYKDRKLDLDTFTRPFCRECGSRNIYIKAGTYVDHWYCLDCGVDEIM